MRGGGEVVIRPKKEGTVKMAWKQQSNYWRGMREYEFTKRQQQGIVVPNPDNVNPAKPLIPEKYNNQMEMNKIKREKYFTKEIL